jgi:plasmid stabilization system protein ParE
MKSYKIVLEEKAINRLNGIYEYIKQQDSSSQAKSFIKKLEKQINTLTYMPQRCRKSLYIEDKNTKDLVYKGYTIVYKILNNSVHILTIFRQRSY